MNDFCYVFLMLSWTWHKLLCCYIKLLHIFHKTPKNKNILLFLKRKNLKIKQALQQKGK